MIYRLVKMEFDEANAERFLEVFESSKENIRAFKGCEHLQLWRDENDPNIFFTYSHWLDSEALNNYRNSDLFKDTWAKTKILFRARAQAWSVSPKFRLD